MCEYVRYRKDGLYPCSPG